MTPSRCAGNAVAEPDVERVVAETVRHFGRLDIIVNMAGKVHWSSVRRHGPARLERSGAELPDRRHAHHQACRQGDDRRRRAAAASSICCRPRRISARPRAPPTRRRRPRFSTSRARRRWTSPTRASASTPSRPAPWSTSSGPTCARRYSIRTSRRRRRRSFYSRDDYLKMIPLERFPRASDLAWAAVFLASDEVELHYRRRHPGRWRVALQVSDLAARRPHRREHSRLRQQASA